MKKLVRGTIDTSRVVTGKIDVDDSTANGSKALAAVAKAVGLQATADASEIRAAVAELLRARDIEIGARQLGLSARQAKALAAMPPRKPAVRR